MLPDHVFFNVCCSAHALVKRGPGATRALQRMVFAIARPRRIPLFLFDSIVPAFPGLIK